MNQSALLMFDQPWSSQFPRCLVSLSIEYLESVTIVRGAVGLTVCRVATIAASSPIWLDWALPGTRIALFDGLFFPNHIPLPHVASSFPFRRQQPSVYTVVWSICWPCSLLRFLMRYAGSVMVVWFLLVRILKHSSSDPLAVMVGSKIISSPFSIDAFSFFSFLLCVKVKPSFLGWSYRLYKSSLIPVISLASCAQL